MTLTLLLGKRHGIFATVYVSLWGALLADFSQAVPFAIISAFAGLIGSWSVRKLRKRSQLLRAGLYAGLAPFVALVLLQIAGGTFDREWHGVATDGGINIATGLATAMLVGGMLPLRAYPEKRAAFLSAASRCAWSCRSYASDLLVCRRSG